MSMDPSTMNSTSQRQPASEISPSRTQAWCARVRSGLDVRRVQSVQEAEKLPEGLDPGVASAISHEPIMARFGRVLFCRVECVRHKPTARSLWLRRYRGK